MRLLAMLAPDLDTIGHNGEQGMMKARAGEELAYQSYHGFTCFNRSAIVGETINPPFIATLEER